VVFQEYYAKHDDYSDTFLMKLNYAGQFK